MGTAVRLSGELARPLSAAAGLRWIVIVGGSAQALGIG
jgi:hypothetical protein